MKNIKVNEYKLESPKFNKNRTIVNMSDIHSNIDALNCIIKILEEIKASYIYMPGDILDSINNPTNEEMMKLLKKIGNISQTFISMGNHEMLSLQYKNGKKLEIESTKYIEYFKKLNEISKCVSLISSFSQMNIDNDLSVSAINVPFSYYAKKEDLIKWKNFLQTANSQIITDEDKFNILLLHSPNALIQKEKIDTSLEFIKNMNLILCGHNHGGLVPTWAQDVIKGHYGLVGPYAKILNPNAYGIYDEENTSILIGNGVTKISATSEAKNINGILNKIYTPEIDLIYMEQSNKHSLKLINRSVHKF